MKPPAACPCCGDPPAELVKRWEQQALPSGRTLRYPVSVRATYHCGATVDAQYIVRTGVLTGSHSGAFWRLIATSGCTKAVAVVLKRVSR